MADEKTVKPENNKTDGTQTVSGNTSTEKTEEAKPVLVSPPDTEGVNKLARAREMLGSQHEKNKAYEDAAVDARQQADKQARSSPMTAGEEMRIAVATDQLPRTFHEGTTYVDQDGLTTPRNPNPMHNKNDWQPSDPPADTQPMVQQPAFVARTQAFLYDPPAPLPEAPIGHPKEVIVRDRPNLGVQTTQVKG